MLGKTDNIPHEIVIMTQPLILEALHEAAVVPKVNFPKLRIDTLIVDIQQDDLFRRVPGRNAALWWLTS